MQIGYNQICINPIKPTNYVGFFTKKDPIINVRGDLYARCIRLKDSQHNIIIIAFDSLGITSDIQALFISEIKQTINEDAEFIFSCTHTHYAPSACNMPGLINIDKPYLTYAISKVALMIKNCHMSEKALTVNYSWEKCNKVGRTRIKNKSDENIYAGVLSFYDDNSRIGNILFYNCHPTTLQDTPNYFSSAYPGSAVETLTKRYPSEFFIFLQGADGDVSTRLTRRSTNFEEVTRLGNEMAKAFHGLMDKNMNSSKKKLTLKLQNIELEIDNQLKDINLFDEKRCLNMTDKEKAVLLTGLNFVDSMKDKYKPHKSTVTFSCLTLASYHLIFNPFELFTDYNDYIDKNKTLLVCYSQGINGYLTQPDNQHLSYEYYIELQTENDKTNVVDLIKNFNEQSI